MGMSSDMSPRYLTVNPSGQVTYILDTNSIGLAQVQLAVPASEVLLIQEEDKSVSLSNNSILVADVGATENLNLLGNNVIVLVSQAQEVMIVNSDMAIDANTTSQWDENDESSGPTATLFPGTVAHLVTNMVTDATEEDWLSERESACNTPVTTDEDARCWFRDSLITTAALSSLSTFIHSRATSKDS